MKVNLNKKRGEIIFLALAIILLAVLIPTHQAKADCFSVTGGLNIDDCVVNVANLILNILGKAIGYFAGLLDSFIKYQTDNGVYNVLVVEQSWAIIRDFVNMFFILVLIIMAFGTIFDIKKYTWREMLVPFLIAALLINFSLVIGQYIITVSNGLASVFLKQIQNSGGVSNTFASGTGIVKTMSSGTTDLVAGSLGVVATAIFAIIFLAIVMLTFAAVAIFSIVRLFMLWFLLIISPIAWIGLSLPNIRKQTWSDWWKQFLCWCFFLPYFLFFMMFAVMFVINKSTFKPVTSATGTNITMAGMALTDLMFYILSLIFLIGGMVVARKMACASGTGIKTVFGKIEGGVRRYAPGAAYVRGGVAGLEARREEIKEKGVLGIGGAQRVGEKEIKAKGWIASIPGLGRMPGAREEASRAMVAKVDEEVKKLKASNSTPNQLNEKLKSTNKPEQLAAFKLKAENGWLEASDLDTVNKTIRDAGGGKTALGTSIIQSLKKGKFHEMAKSTDDKQRIFTDFEDLEVKKAFGLDMAESRELMSESLATQLLNLYEGDTLEVKKKVEEAVKNNVENFAKDKSQREAILTRAVTPTTTKAEKKLKELTAKTMADKKEIDSWKVRRSALEAAGGIDAATGQAMTAEGRVLAKSIDDGNVLFKEEKDYRDRLGIADHTIDLNPTQRTEVHEQILGNIKTGYIKGFSTEELKTPEIFNALWYGLNAPPSPALAITPVEFKKLTGISGKGKPDRKKRVAAEAIRTAAAPMAY